MSSTILAFEGVVIEVPEDVSVSFSQGKLRLLFTQFTGSLTCSASSVKSAAESVGAVEPNPHTTKRANQVESKANVEGIDSLTKRPRFESPCDVSSDEAAEQRRDSAGAGAASLLPSGALLAAVGRDPQTESLRASEVYQNGGGSFFASLSQDSDADESAIGSPAKPLSWEEACQSSCAAPEAAANPSVMSDAEMTQPAAAAPSAPAMPEAAADQRPVEATVPALFPDARAPEVAPEVAPEPAPETAPESYVASMSPIRAGVGSPAAAIEGLAEGVEGGADGAAAAVSFAFDSNSSFDCWEWAPIEASGEAPGARWAHAAVSLCGEMHIFGGDPLGEDGGADALGDLYAFDAAEARWRRGRDAPQARAWHSGSALQGGVQGNSEILLVFGGEGVKSNGRKAAVNTMLAYDPEFEVWYDAVDRGQRPSARSGHSACVHLANGAGSKLLVFGGWSGKRFAEPELHELRIETDWAWKRLLSGDSPPAGRAYHTATPIAGERVLVFGGNDTNRAFDAVHVLDLASMSWVHPVTRGDAPRARTGHSAICLDGCRVLIYGGWDYKAEDDDGFEFRDDLYILDTRDWSWSQPRLRGAAPPPRAGHSMVALSPKAGAALYLFGGRTEDDEALADLYTLRPVAP